jgi:hypothetical protein
MNDELQRTEMEVVVVVVVESRYLAKIASVPAEIRTANLSTTNLD